MLRDDGRLSATAFRLSQAKYVSDLDDEEAAFSPDEHQIMVREVEELTGLDFGRLKDYDPLDGAESFTEGEESAGVIVTTSSDRCELSDSSRAASLSVRRDRPRAVHLLSRQRR